MDNVSWGTRENKKPDDMVEQVEQKPQVSLSYTNLFKMICSLVDVNIYKSN